MPLLILSIKQAELRGHDNGQPSYCTVKISSVKNQTALQYGENPHYNQEFLFELTDTNYELKVEVWEAGRFWDSILGFFTIDLRTIRHSSEEECGQWYQFAQPVDQSFHDPLMPMFHRILLDIRFELPLELNAVEALIIQERLNFIAEQNARNPPWATDIYGLAEKKQYDLLHQSSQDNRDFYKKAWLILF